MTTGPPPGDGTADVDIAATSDTEPRPADALPLTTDVEAQLDDSLVDPGAS